jgi:citrate synthase
MKPKSQRSTALSDESQDPIRIRGYAISELIDRVPFDSAIFLLLVGELPTKAQRTVFSACLTAAIDHGPHAPSTDVARRVASNGTPVNAAVGAGVSSIGDHHGGAIEQFGALLQEAVARKGSTVECAKWLVETGLKAHNRLPGFGHRVYTEQDPRVAAMFSVAEKNGINGNARSIATAAETELMQIKGKKFPLNIDGGMAAVLTDLGLPWKLFRGLFIIARTPGLVAQVREQLDREPPVIRGEDTVGYDGPGPRSLPKA